MLIMTATERVFMKEALNYLLKDDRVLLVDCFGAVFRQ
jgi:hypothetical protein